MLNRAKTLTNQVASFFKSTPPTQPFVPAHTRFSSAVELKAIADALQKINAKKDSLRKLADEKGVESPEEATYAILNHILEITKERVTAFNAAGYKKDDYSNVRDMYELTAQLKAIVLVSEDDKEKLNSVTVDKPIAKNATIGAAFVAAPVAAVAIVASGGLALLAGVGALALMRPANDYLTKEKVISWDTESKELVLSFIDVVDKTNVELSKYLAENKPVQENSMSALKLV